MKTTKISLIIILLTFFTTGCNKLDIPPINIITGEEIFSNEAGVEAYLSRLYQALPIEDFAFNKDAGFNEDWGVGALGLNTGEMTGAYNYEWSIASGFGYWPYTDIRRVNDFIETLPQYSDNFDQETIDNWLGEAYFARAYYYFGLVKRYGGVPIITHPQDYPGEPLENLQVSRNKEDEVYAFILSDLDQAIALLKENSAIGKANKYVAASLKSRAMLYAGSIAKYGNVQLDGLVGIPRDKAIGYFKESYAAAKIVEEGGYSLYRGNTNKVQNFVDVFFDGGSSENIFVKQFSLVDERSTNWEIFFVPAQMRGPDGYGSLGNPTIEFVELFGDLKYNDASGKPIRFDKIEDLLPNIEPRLRATVMFPGETWLNQKIDVLGGVYESYPNGTLHQETSTDILWNGMRLTGFSGLGPHESTKSGFFMRKTLNYKAQSTSEFTWGRKEDAWIDFRYAEILLNKAEAACELFAEGETGEDYLSEAWAAINDIRDRAGAQLVASAGDLADINIVRIERRRELAFENHTWWDLRRWRTAHIEIDHKHYKSFAPYYVYDEKKYIFLKARSEFDGEFTFEQKMYYEPIPQEEIDKNRNLLPQNPLW